MSWLWDALGWVLANWPYWMPIVTLLVGYVVGTGKAEDEGRKQLSRLTRSIEVPKGWRDGAIDVPLDGEPTDRPGMARAGLMIRPSPENHGSGVCISSAGLVLTNAHVVADAPIVEVEDDRFSRLGVVVKVDQARDVAAIYVGPGDLPTACVCSGELEVGDDLFVAGTPLREENKNLLTHGVVSKIGDFQGAKHYFMDAAVAPGNSGGPVFDEQGRLVGLSVAVQTNGRELTHIGIAIPIAEALSSLKIGDVDGPA